MHLTHCFDLKIHLGKKICSGIIYRYKCSNCKVTYYGKTFRYFYTRIAEHMGISNLTGKRYWLCNYHLLQCNYAISFDNFAISFDNFSILATDCNKFKFLLRVSLLIKRDKPILSSTIKSFPLWLRWQFNFQYNMIARFSFTI